MDPELYSYLQQTFTKKESSAIDNCLGSTTSTLNLGSTGKSGEMENEEEESLTTQVVNRGV